MDTGIRGTTARLELEVVVADAQAAIEAAAERLRALSDEVRAGYTTAHEHVSPTDRASRPSAAADDGGRSVVSASAVVDRLQLAARELDQAARTVGSPAADASAAAGSAYGGARASEAATARAVLAGQEQERARLAAELHDGTAQALANIIFQTEVLDHSLRRDPAAAGLELAALRGLLQRELDALRAYVNQLRPAMEEGAGLDDALRDSAAQLAERASIPVEVRLEGPADELDEPSRAVALRIAQEALRNVGKHAAASRAWLMTHIEENGTGGDRWVLEVGDDGRGFDVAGAGKHPRSRHFGLRFMRERAQLLGAQLTIDAAPAAGTVIRLSISTRRGRES